MLLRYLRWVLLWRIIYYPLLIWWRWCILINSTEVLTWVSRSLRGPCYCRCWHRQCRVIAACISVIICVLFTRWNGQINRLCPFAALLYTLGYIEVPVAVLGGGCRRWFTHRLLHVGSWVVYELWRKNKAIILSATIGCIFLLVVLGRHTRHPDHLIGAIITIYTLIAPFYVS